MLRQLKALYGMADEMDTTDFFNQNKQQTNIVFVKEDELQVSAPEDIDTNCAKVLQKL